MSDALLDRQAWINDERNILAFRKNIIEWGKQNFRSFPWRETNNPYHVLMAEVMLHRTQVSQVVPIYEEFIRQFSELSKLINANPDELRIILHPLGLHWRIDLIYQMGQVLQEKFNGQVPIEKDDLLSLPGVSDYIAGAVRCFAWNLPEPLIDTNMARIIGRIFGWQIKDSSRRNIQFRDALSSLVDPHDSRSYNYALLDLAHLVCLKKQAPLCNQCPLIAFCYFGQSIRIT